MSFKLSPAIKMRWIRALRSGNYTQGRSSLCSFGINGGETCYCCLGVYKRVMSNRKLSYADTTRGRLWNRSIPDKIQDMLINFNDVEKWSFGRIANWIEKNL